MDHPQPDQIADSLSNWLAHLVTIGGGLASVCAGAWYGVRRARRVWLAVSQFVGLLDRIEQIAADVAVLAARQQLHSTLHINPIWEADATGNCTNANPAYLEMLGVTFDDVAGAAWSSYIHPEDRAVVVEVWRAAAASGSRFRATFRLVRGDGLVIRVASHAAPVKDANGKVSRFIGTDSVIEAHEQA